MARSTTPRSKAIDTEASAFTGIPYEIDGRRVSRAEYVAWEADQTRQANLAALHAAVAETAGG